ncbi:hypothetical protein [Oscillatoria salina]|uniref:hypothetical protein n=1 Tax=Oscillatoria salina TaxID=331517 RepID=UPI001CCD83EA|nr:hypothetical protein [Oscillatoria salina]
MLASCLRFHLGQECRSSNRDRVICQEAGDAPFSLKVKSLPKYGKAAGYYWDRFRQASHQSCSWD